MIITCPSCSTTFAVPDSALRPRGRILKCARCGHKWHQMPPEGDDVPLEMEP
ncbi:MAG: zinc-ribbon domain-containing protein, partial [Rhodospirillales bacterium]|nr:zinc-ribbon domain-containing protein [Rhodospirillales bacterium]